MAPRSATTSPRRRPKAEGGLGLGTNLTSIIFLSTILGLVVFLAVTKRDVIRSGPETATAAALDDGSPAVLVVLNKVEATSALLEAVRGRAAAGAAGFHVLVPSPDHLAFDRNSPDVADGEELLTRVVGQLEEPAGGNVAGRIAYSPNAYDDIVEELKARRYQEIILETPPSHFSHWLHIDLLHRVGELGYPVQAVPATSNRDAPTPRQRISGEPEPSGGS